MAIIRNPTDLDNPINYVATVAFFCCVSCAVFMLKFGGFKANFNLITRNKKELELAPNESTTGAYRINRDEFFENGSISDPPKKLTPSMVKLPPSSEPVLRPTKSTSDLVRQADRPPQATHRSTHNVSLDPRGGPSANGPGVRASAPPTAPERKRRDAQAKNQQKERKKLEKQRLAEEKARAKAQAQEQAKQEKIRREQEKKAAKEQALLIKRNKKRVPVPPQAQRANPAPPQTQVANRAPLQAPSTNPIPQQPQRTHPLALNQAPPPPPPPAPAQYSTNTLESSISRSNGPPPYSNVTLEASQKSGNSNTSNVSFGKKLDNSSSSWDMVSQHREQMSRPVASGVTKSSKKNMVMDLQYKLGPKDDKANSDA